MTKYCPFCKNNSDEVEFIGELCFDCVTKDIMKTLPDEVIIEKCKMCGRVNTLDGYINHDRKGIELAIMRSVRKEVKVLDFDETTASVAFLIKKDNEILRLKKILKLKFHKITCQSCQKRTSGYYEGIVQLRGDLERAERMIDKLLKYLESEEGFISKVDSVEGGYDVYTSNKILTTKFFDRLRLVPKRSYVFYGTRNGKQLYRNIYMLRL